MTADSRVLTFVGILAHTFDLPGYVCPVNANPVVGACTKRNSCISIQFGFEV